MTTFALGAEPTFGPFDALIRAARGVIVGAAGILVVIAVAITALAVAGVGMLVTLAALAVGFLGRTRRPARDPKILEARRTPNGWVVEAK